MDVRRIYVRKVVFQFYLSLKVHWLERNEVPANNYTGNVQFFVLVCLFVLHLQNLGSISPNSLISTQYSDSQYAKCTFLQGQYCTGECRKQEKKKAAGTRRPNPSHQLSSVLLLTPVFQAVADSCNNSAQCSFFAIIFQIRVIGEPALDGNHEQAKYADRFRHLPYLLLFLFTCTLSTLILNKRDLRFIPVNSIAKP